MRAIMKKIQKIEVCDIIESYVELDGHTLNGIVENFCLVMQKNKQYNRITLNQEESYTYSDKHWNILGWRLETDDEYNKRLEEQECWKIKNEKNDYETYLKLKERFEK